MQSEGMFAVVTSKLLGIASPVQAAEINLGKEILSGQLVSQVVFWLPKAEIRTSAYAKRDPPDTGTPGTQLVYSRLTTTR